MKYIKKFENVNKKDLTYHEFIELYKYDNDILNYFLNTYPKENIKYYIPKYRGDIINTTLQKLKKLAKKTPDDTLLDMINMREKHIEKCLKEIELKRETQKYNL